MIRNASARSKGSNSETTDDSNAYAAADDWTADDLGTLSSSIQQHAANIAGKDDDDDDDDAGGGGGGDGFLDEELQSRPIQSSLVGSDGTGASARSFTSFGRDGDSVTGGGDPRKTYSQQRPKSVLRSNRRYGGGGGGIMGDYHNNTNDDGSVHSRVSFSANTKRPPRVYAAYQPTKHGTKIRATIALCCLVGSIVLAVLWGHGTAGLWIARTVVGAPGTTAVKEGPTTDGIPGPLGMAPPAFNGTFEIPNLMAMDIVLGPELENLADWRIPFPAANRTDLPIFWDIQRSGGTAVRRILGQCLGLVEVSQEGASHTEPVRKHAPLYIETHTQDPLSQYMNDAIGVANIRNVAGDTLRQCRFHHGRGFATGQGIGVAPFGFGRCVVHVARVGFIGHVFSSAPGSVVCHFSSSPGTGNECVQLCPIVQSGRRNHVVG